MTMNMAASAAAETGNPSQETIMISGYECYFEDGEYFTTVNGEKRRFINPWESESITDFELVNELNTFSTRAVSELYPSGWQNCRDVSLLYGQTHTARVNLEYYETYYSPGYIVDVPNNHLVVGAITVDFLNIGLTETKTIHMSVYIRLSDTGEWKTAAVNEYDFNILIPTQNLETGKLSSHIDKICIKMHDVTSNYSIITGPYPMTLDYTIAQT